MSSVSFPLTHKALGSEALSAPMSLVQKSIEGLSAGELLVRVTHGSINFMDTAMQHRNPFQLPMPLVLGFDVAGEVVAVADSEAGADGGSALAGESVEVGAKVCALAMRAGGFGEYVVLQRAHTVLRHEVPSAEASTFGIAFSTAYEGVETELRVAERSGQTILIPGAAGGCGHFAVQMAKRAGMRVIGTASKAEGVALLTELGCDLVLDYSKQDVEAAVLSFTGGRGVDAVWDSTYQRASLEQSARCVAKGGVWCMLGEPYQFAARGVDAAAYEQLLDNARARGATATYSDYGRWTMPGPRMESRPNLAAEVLQTAVRYYREGSLKPRITATVPFEPAQLQRTLDEWNAHNVGKLVVQVAAE